MNGATDNFWDTCKFLGVSCHMICLVRAEWRVMATLISRVSITVVQ